MTELLTGIVGGFLGSAHCMGMCGGIAAALGSSTLPLRPVLSRQFAYNLGRVFTYSFLGAVCGSAGLMLSRYQGGLVTAQQVFSIIAGVLMLLIGLSVLGLLRFPTGALWGLGELIPAMFKQCMNARSLPGFFAVGMANGLLPCGLVYAFLALALATGDMAAGAVLMAGFGLGTMPAMMLIGCGARLLSHTVRLQVLRVAACFVVLLGAATIVRAIPGNAENCCAEHVEGEG